MPDILLYTPADLSMIADGDENWLYLRREGEVGPPSARISLTVLAAFIRQPRPAIEISGNVTASVAWHDRELLATAETTITIPRNYPAGIRWNAARDTAAAVVLVVETTEEEGDTPDLIHSTLGDPGEITAVGISDRNGLLGFYRPALGRVSVVGNLVDVSA